MSKGHAPKRESENEDGQITLSLLTCRILPAHLWRGRGSPSKTDQFMTYYGTTPKRTNGTFPLGYASLIVASESAGIRKSSA